LFFRLAVNGSTITNAGAEGVRIQSLGAVAPGALVSAAISNNMVTNSALEGIRLDGNGVSSLSAEVAANPLAANAGVADFLAQANDTSDMCIELLSTGSGLPATFQVNNAGTGTFNFFETGVDAIATRVGAITSVPQGTCNVP